jgi:hypothetical protein
MGRGNLPLARYQDRRGRAHLVVMRGRLLLDVCVGDLPRVVAELSEGEGADQARSLLRGDGGYLERARLAERPICRPLRPEDLRVPPSAEKGASVREGEEPGLAA